MSVTVTGAGFPANTEVTVDIHSTIVELGTETTDADGSFEETFDVPCRVGAGEHEVTATTETGQEAEDDVELDGCSAAQAPQPVTVTPTFTG
jgi:hypothetical protein